ncbi:MAG: hypothetical protein ACRCXK_02420, partial [Wohlfahrtiimonas sp.]
MANFFDNLKFWLRGYNPSENKIGKSIHVNVTDETKEFGITYNNNEKEIYEKVSQVQKVVNKKAQMFAS